MASSINVLLKGSVKYGKVLHGDESLIELIERTPKITHLLQGPEQKCWQFEDIAESNVQ